MAPSYYVFFFAALALNRSTRPAVSINLPLPVKKGWHFEQISTSIFSLVEPVTITFPQPHLISARGKYLG